jgi:cytochrome c biogenesis protein CcdA
LSVIYLSLGNKPISRGLLFIAGALIIQFLLGLSVFYHPGKNWFALYVLIALAAAVSAIDIITFIRKGNHLFLSLVGSFHRALVRWGRGIKKVVTSPPGAIIVGALSSLLLLPCQGSTYLLLSSLIIQKATIKPVLLLLLYIIPSAIPLIVVVWLIRRYLKRLKEMPEKQQKRHRAELQLIVGYIILLVSLIMLFVAIFAFP